jgi:hypothetical protein
MTDTDKLQDLLLIDLKTLIQHLDKYEVKFWSDYFQKISKLIDNGDIRGLDSLTNMRGGMGSFTDLVICKINSHAIEEKKEDFANSELMRLGELVFKSADKLKRLIK